MSEETANTPGKSPTQETQIEKAEGSVPEPGETSKWLEKKGFNHKILEKDHLEVETIGIEPNHLIDVAEALKEDGFNYLQCQGGYDEGPGQKLVCFYHLIAMKDLTEDDSKIKIREVRLKVFLSRDGDLRVPSLYKLFRGSDWQERETYDMFGINFEGHPHPKRLLMPEDWKGWPLRKDYVQPDFYEMQDAF
tara:strand:- start:2286 stop:2861 length:576 start_codon:yes stop_codon:yes gene_type:complete